MPLPFRHASQMEQGMGQRTRRRRKKRRQQNGGADLFLCVFLWGCRIESVTEGSWCMVWLLQLLGNNSCGVVTRRSQHSTARSGTRSCSETCLHCCVVAFLVLFSGESPPLKESVAIFQAVKWKICLYVGDSWLQRVYFIINIFQYFS